jgi:hypothetical protein
MHLLAAGTLTATAAATPSTTAAIVRFAFRCPVLG